MSLKTGIIGAGGRIKETVLPGIVALGERAEIVQINSRTSKDVPLHDGTAISTSTDLAQIDFSKLDLLIVAVGTPAIRGVLAELRKLPGRGNTMLMMDTPPLRFSDIRRMGIFKGYRGVSVAEDWIKMQPILKSRELIENGSIGELRSIQLLNSGYRYHALATIKTLAGVNAVRSMRRKNLGKDIFETNIKLAGKATARLVEPRDYENGRTQIVGTGGVISDFPIEEDKGSKFQFSYPETNSGWFQPTVLNGEPLPEDDIDQHLKTLPQDFLLDKTPINLLKIRAYARLLEEVIAGKNPYSIQEGLYDYLAVTLAEKYGRFWDLSLSGLKNSTLLRLMGIHN